MTLDEIDASILKLTEIVDLRKIVCEKDAQIDGLKDRLAGALEINELLRIELEKLTDHWPL